MRFTSSRPTAARSLLNDPRERHARPETANASGSRSSSPQTCLRPQRPPVAIMLGVSRYTVAEYNGNLQTRSGLRPARAAVPAFHPRLQYCLTKGLPKLLAPVRSTLLGARGDCLGQFAERSLFNRP